MSTYSIYYETFLKDNVSTRLSQMGREFQNAFSGVQSTIQGFDKIGNVGRGLALRISAPLTLGLGKALRDFAQFEKMEVGITTVLQNKGQTQQEIQRFIKDLQGFAVRSPMRTADVFQLSQMMLAMGFSSKEMVQNMSMFGDITSATSADLNRFVMNYSQVKTIGYLQWLDAKQFMNNNIQLMDILSKYLNTSEGKIKEMLESGTISFATFEAAMRSTVATGGRFYGAMEKGMNTLSGRYSSMMDSITLTSKAFGESFNEIFKIGDKMSAIASVFDKLLEKFNALSEGNKKLIASLVIAGIAIPPLLIGFSVLGKAFTYTFATLSPLLRSLHIFSGIKLFSNLGVQRFNLHLATTTFSLKNIVKQLMAFRHFDRWVGLAVSFETGFINVFSRIFTFIRAGFSRFFTVYIIFMTLFKVLRGVWTGFMSTFQGDAQGIFRILGKVGSVLGSIFTFMNQIIEFATTSIEVLAILVGQGLGTLFNKITKWINEFTYAIKNVAESLGFKFKTDEEKKKEKENNEDIKNLPKHVQDRIIALRQKEKESGHKQDIIAHPIEAMASKIDDINLFKEDLLTQTEKMQQARIDRINKQKMEIKSSITLENKTDTPAKVTDTKTTLAQSGGNIFRVKGLNSDNTSVFI